MSVKLTRDQALDLYVDYLLPDFSTFDYLEYNHEHDVVSQHNPLIIEVNAGATLTTHYFRVFFIMSTPTEVTLTNATASKVIQYGDRYIIVGISEHHEIIVRNNNTGKSIIGGAF